MVLTGIARLILPSALHHTASLQILRPVPSVQGHRHAAHLPLLVRHTHTHVALSDPVPSYCLCHPRQRQTPEPAFFLQTADIVQRKQLRRAQTRPRRFPLISPHIIICHFSIPVLPPSSPSSYLSSPPCSFSSFLAPPPSPPSYLPSPPCYLPSPSSYLPLLLPTFPLLLPPLPSLLLCRKLIL